MTFEIKPKQDIINQMIVDIATNTTKINDFNPGSIIRTLVEAIGQEIYEQYSQMNLIYEGTKILTAVGDDLDNIGSIVGVQRLGGTKAKGYVSFFRGYDVYTDFVIPADTIVTTAPSVENVYQYKTLADETFELNLYDTFKFKQGVRDYKLSQRRVFTLYAVSGTKSGNVVFFNYGDEYDIVKLTKEYIVTDINNVSTIFDCDTTAGWNTMLEAIAPALEGANKIQGTSSLKLGKSGTSQRIAGYYKDITGTIDITNKIVFVNLFIKDQETINKINYIDILLLNNKNNPMNNIYKLSYSNFKIGWQTIAIDYRNQSEVSRVTTPIPIIERLQININTILKTHEISSGDILLDYIFLAPGEKYTGEVVRIENYDHYPDDGTNVNVDWQPYTWDVMCEALENGNEYNVTRYAINYRASPVGNISTVLNLVDMKGGETLENDDAYKKRIYNAATYPSKGSSKGLINELLTIQGVNDVAVFDAPLVQIKNEPHVYNSLINKYHLDREQINLSPAMAPANILVSNTFNGAEDYIYGINYTVDDNNNLLWLSSPPTNGNMFFVSYEINQVAHTELLISGDELPIPLSVANDIDNKLNEIKPLGVSIAWEEPTLVKFNIGANIIIDIDAGYSSTSEFVYELETAVKNWLNSLKIGEVVRVSKYYSVVSSVKGVVSVTITNWNGTLAPPFNDANFGIKSIVKAGFVTFNILP